MSTQTVQVTGELINSFEGMMRKIINEKFKLNYRSSDVCWEIDDLLQECRMRLHKHLHKYNPTRGMSLTSYAYQLIDSHLGNLRGKAYRLNTNGTISFTEANVWSEFGGQRDQDTAKYAIKWNDDHHIQEDVRINLVDKQNVLNKLKGNMRLVFEDHFIKGMSVKEIEKKNPTMRYNQIHNMVKKLKKINETLCD